MRSRIHSFTPPSNPIAQAASLLLVGLLAIGAVLLGAVILSVVLGFAVIAALVMFVRIWWIRRKFGRARSDARSRSGEIVEVEYRVIEERKLPPDERD